MTHRSRLATVLVDVPSADHARAVGFWSAALGATVDGPDDDTPEYVSLGQPISGLQMLVQSTDDPASRAHFDIETDDVEAEVTRLTALGATEVGRHHTWVVMRDPVGTVFCVVRVQLPEAFDAGARTWD
jgi:predicted enzyme related to lactoylglutathione lyase